MNTQVESKPGVVDATVAAIEAKAVEAFDNAVANAEAKEASNVVPIKKDVIVDEGVAENKPVAPAEQPPLDLTVKAPSEPKVHKPLINPTKVMNWFQGVGQGISEGLDKISHGLLFSILWTGHQVAKLIIIATMLVIAAVPYAIYALATATRFAWECAYRGWNRKSFLDDAFIQQFVTKPAATETPAAVK